MLLWGWGSGRRAFPADRTQPSVGRPFRSRTRASFPQQIPTIDRFLSKRLKWRKLGLSQVGAATVSGLEFGAHGSSQHPQEVLKQPAWGFRDCVSIGLLSRVGVTAHSQARSPSGTQVRRGPFKGRRVISAARPAPRPPRRRGQCAGAAHSAGPGPSRRRPRSPGCGAARCQSPPSLLHTPAPWAPEVPASGRGEARARFGGRVGSGVGWGVPGRGSGREGTEARCSRAAQGGDAVPWPPRPVFPGEDGRPVGVPASLPATPAWHGPRPEGQGGWSLGSGWGPRERGRQGSGQVRCVAVGRPLCPVHGRGWPWGGWLAA